MERLSKAAFSVNMNPVTEKNTEITKTKLSSKLGTLDIVFTVLAYNAPLTVITGYMPLIMMEGNGLGLPLAFLAAGCLIMLFAFGFTAMSKHAPNPGAFYSYIAIGLGRHLGLGSAFVAIMAYFFMTFSIYCYAGISYSTLSNTVLGTPLMPWWGWSFIIMALVAVLGYLKVTLSAAVLSFALLLEVLLVITWDGAVFVTNGVSNFSTEWLSLSNFTSGSVGVAILLAVGSFAGFEATAIFREEAKDPEKTIPRSTFLAVGILAALFIVTAIAYITAYGATSVVSATHADPANAILNSVRQYLGNAGANTMNVLLCSSIFACLLAMQNILSRYVYSLASDRVLFRKLAEVHPKHQSPHYASLLVSTIAAAVVSICVVCDVDPYKGYGGLGGVGGYALMLLQLLTAVSIIAYFAKVKHTYSWWRAYFAPGLAAVGLFSTSWLATTNMELLTGDTTLAYSLMGLAFALLAIGVLYAHFLKYARPDAYRRIGRQEI
ncbi:APC family permease [Pseudomonas sp. H11T01]|uniref:APC family permease n=1 Tax=Pseudomonas sp. H11T01 TaxID=3402749 RepID=UPI003AC993CE